MSYFSFYPAQKLVFVTDFYRFLTAAEKRLFSAFQWAKGANFDFLKIKC